jgi:hypothetical protein
VVQTSRTAIELIARLRASPTANTPDWLVSMKNGSRGAEPDDLSAARRRTPRR